LTIARQSKRSGRARQDRRQHLKQRDERDVDDDQLGPVRAGRQARARGVDALEHRHAVVGAQLTPARRTATSTAITPPRPALEQAVGEPARSTRRRPCTAGPSTGTAERLQRVSSLMPPRETNRRPAGDRDLGVLVDHPPRLVGELVADPHLARHHRCRGARTRREEAALGQELVEADLGGGHGGSVSAGSAA
jgi:hypothetical protein